MSVTNTINRRANQRRSIKSRIRRRSHMRFSMNISHTSFRRAIFGRLTSTRTLNTNRKRVRLTNSTTFRRIRILKTPSTKRSRIRIVRLNQVNLNRQTQRRVHLFLIVTFRRRTITKRSRHLRHHSGIINQRCRAINRAFRRLGPPLLLTTPPHPSHIKKGYYYRSRSANSLS